MLIIQHILIKMKYRVSQISVGIGFYRLVGGINFGDFDLSRMRNSEAFHLSVRSEGLYGAFIACFKT